MSEPLPLERALERAILSLLDVVEELAQGLAHGATPETDWSQMVADTIEEHRREIREAER